MKNISNKEEPTKTPTKLTKNSNEILQLFKGDHVSLSAHEIVEKLKTKADRATVYRNLNYLCSEELLHKVNFKDEATKYELSELGHHHHLVCVNCRSVISINTDNLGAPFESISLSANKKHGFAINDHVLEFYGLCKDCRKDEE